MTVVSVLTLVNDDDGVEYDVKIMAVAICFVLGIAPVDPLDGSSNWWGFVEEAKRLLVDLYTRFPKIDNNKPKPE